MKIDIITEIINGNVKKIKEILENILKKIEWKNMITLVINIIL